MNKSLTAGDPSERVRLNFSGLSAAVVVDFNTSLAFEHVVSEGAASDAPSRVDGIPLFVPWLITRGSIIVYPGATVRKPVKISEYVVRHPLLLAPPPAPRQATNKPKMKHTSITWTVDLRKIIHINNQRF